MARGATIHSDLPAARPDPPPAPAGPPILDLSDERSRDSAIVGAKAASLARAANAGLPTLPGFVITTTAASTIQQSRSISPLHPSGHDAADLTACLPGSIERPLRAAWGVLSQGGSEELVVRSSSTVEDGGSSSMAGMFTSVLGVRGWEAFAEAVWTVLTSAKEVGGAGSAPLAVLVQRQLSAARSGVMFGIDPITGRDDRLVVSAVAAGLDRLVSGAVDGTRHVLSRRGRLIEVDRGDLLLGLSERTALARLAARAAAVFGGPQDIEWAIDERGHLWLFQSRPVTTTAAQAAGPVLGPGPVAETLPGVLSPLEQELWVEPLARGIAGALEISGTAPRRQIRRSPVVAVVNGRVAADLDLLGVRPPDRPMLARLDPRPPVRRLVAAWRVGRLRAALPALGSALVARVDSDLAEVPPLAEMPNEDLAAILRRVPIELRAIHGHEVLMGLLLADGAAATSAAAHALRALDEGRAAGFSDDDIVATDPVVLALTGPKVGPRAALPAIAPSHGGDTPVGDPAAVLREDLRLRARWVQELSARIAWELGRRLARIRALDDPRAIRDRSLDEIDALVAGSVRAAPRRRSAPDLISPPLPAAFRLTPDGVPVAVKASGSDAGSGAGGGRGAGVVVHSADDAGPGKVLVVRTLDPGLAPALPELAGLVAETGSVLSHLAILAREFGVPTVVGVADALVRFEEGSTVIVDGTTGEVTPHADADTDAGAVA